MDDIHLEILRRNARLRAWRAVGVPVKGGWELKYRPAGESLWLNLKIGCSTCDDWASPSVGLYIAGGLGSVSARMKNAEINSIYKSDGVAICPHLTPLLGEDPPEVM